MPAENCNGSRAARRAAERASRGSQGSQGSAPRQQQSAYELMMIQEMLHTTETCRIEARREIREISEGCAYMEARNPPPPPCCSMLDKLNEVWAKVNALIEWRKVVALAVASGKVNRQPRDTMDAVIVDWIKLRARVEAEFVRETVHYGHFACVHDGLGL